MPQTYRYHGFYAQDDWRVTATLTVNLGLRYEFTLPPMAGDDEYSDFSPTTPNPAVNNYPGALLFAGFGAGRQGTRSLVPGWYGGIGPRIGLAYALDTKTTIRAGFGRSFSKVTVVSSSSHYAGFIGQYAFNSPNQGVTPAFNWDQGLPSYPLPPQINPAFANNHERRLLATARTPRARRNPLLDFLHPALSSRATPMIEADYNATVGTHLQAGLVNINQVPMSTVNVRSIALRRHAGHQPAQFQHHLGDGGVGRNQGALRELHQSRRAAVADREPGAASVPAVSDHRHQPEGGDKSGHSTYTRWFSRSNHRLGAGLNFQWSYALSKLLTDSDTYYAKSGFAEDNTIAAWKNRSGSSTRPTS